MELVQYIVEKPKDKSKYKVGYKKNEKLNFPSIFFKINL